MQIYSRADLFEIYKDGRENQCEPIGSDSDFQNGLNQDLQDLRYIDAVGGWIDISELPR